MIFTAREKDGLPGGGGVIGQAASPDLFAWKVEKPLFRIGHYGEMEVPQIFELDGWWFCLFGNASRHMEPAYLATGKTGAVMGTHYVRSRSPSDPFELVEDRFFGGDSVGRFYGGRFLRTRTGTPVFLAFLNHRADGRFVGQYLIRCLSGQQGKVTYALMADNTAWRCRTNYRQPDCCIFEQTSSGLARRCA